MVHRVDQYTPISRRQALPHPPPADVSRECAMCGHVERYRGRLCCLLHRCSCPFARAEDGACGAGAKDFRGRAG